MEVFPNYTTSYGSPSSLKARTAEMAVALMFEQVWSKLLGIVSKPGRQFPVFLVVD